MLQGAGAKVNVRSTRFSLTGLPWKQVAARFWQRVNRFPVMGKVVVYEGVLPHFSRKKPLKLENIFRMPMWGFCRKDHILIAYSMFESSKIRDIWVKTLNEKFDAVAVPDPFLVPVYKNSGVRIPIFVVPLGVNYGSLLNAPLKHRTGHPFVFSNLSVINDRKNTKKTIKAFLTAFGDDDRVLLVLNGRACDAPFLKECQDLVRRSGVSNVKLSNKSLARKKYNALLKGTDCYVSLSKGEGFSIIPREAMALGVPVIVTDNTGQSTIARSGLVHPVPSLIEEPAKYRIDVQYFVEGINYDFEVNDAAQAMKDVFSNHSQYLSMSKQAREWAMQYSYKNQALKDLYVRLFFDPKTLVLGDSDVVRGDSLSFNKNNPHSLALYEKYRRLKRE